MRPTAVLILLVLPAIASAQALAVTTAPVRPIACALADSVFGPKGVRKAEVFATYSAERHISIIYTTPPASVGTAPGVVSTDGLLRVPERETVTAPALELTFRVITDRVAHASTFSVQLIADGSIVAESIPTATRIQGAVGRGRVLQSATASLTTEQTLQVVRANKLSGRLGDWPLSVTDQERRDLAAIVAVGLCGSQKPW